MKQYEASKQNALDGIKKVKVPVAKPAVVKAPTVDNLKNYEPVGFSVGAYKNPAVADLDFLMNLINVADQVTKTVASKQKDYGPNNIQRSPYGALQGLTVRLYDKIARAANLTSKDAKPQNESLRDTFVDIAGYGLIGLMLIDGTFPKEK